jgi:hypothetical protein
VGLKGGSRGRRCFSSTLLPKAIEGSIEDDSHDVTGGREEWKKLGMPEGSG